MPCSNTHGVFLLLFLLFHHPMSRHKSASMDVVAVFVLSPFFPTLDAFLLRRLESIVKTIYAKRQVNGPYVSSWVLIKGPSSATTPCLFTLSPSWLGGCPRFGMRMNESP